MANIKITIDKETLQFKAEMEGMRGAGCTTELDAFQKMVGMVTQTQTLKPDHDTVQQKIPHRR